MVASIWPLPVRPIDWGLRDYGLKPSLWPAVTYTPMPGLAPVTVPGCDPDCEHVWGEHQIEKQRSGKIDTSTLEGAPSKGRITTVSRGSWCQRCRGWRGSLGLEPGPEMFVAHIVAIFREVWRVLRDDGVLFLNFGDSYSAGGGNRKHGSQGATSGVGHTSPENNPDVRIKAGLPSKNLVGIPWRVAFALQADGWYLRNDIIWCLSGGAWLYVRSQKGDMPMMVKDLARLDPATVKLWNGEKWTSLLGMTRSKRHGNEIELVLRSGERISCTPTHRFPTRRGLLEASEIQIGDVLQRCRLPQPDRVMDCAIDEDAAWFAGLYIAEGSRSGNTIQLSGHIKETERWARIQRIAAKFGGWATKSEKGNSQLIRVYGKILVAILDELVSGHTAVDKGFAPHVWRYSNAFISSLLDGYLSGDGHYDSANRRWRLGFTRNYNLERDLRTACARLGYWLTLNLSTVKYDGRYVPTFRGEIRKTRSGHRNEKDRSEVVDLRKARCRYVYDLGVSDEPNLFALASGILTHNSKPNPMPESVTDRCTKAHEYLFLLAKSKRYFYDAEAVREDSTTTRPELLSFGGRPDKGYPGHSNDRRRSKMPDGWATHEGGHGSYHRDGRESGKASEIRMGRNRRTVWTIPTTPYKGAHFATFPPALVAPCILAGTSQRGVCPECGAPWERLVKKSVSFESNAGKAAARSGRWELRETEHPRTDVGRTVHDVRYGPTVTTRTTGWCPTCACGPERPIPQGDLDDDPSLLDDFEIEPFPPVPAIVLDNFCGSGTTGEVCRETGRRFVGLDLSTRYLRDFALVRAERKQTAASIEAMPLFSLERQEHK